MTDPAEPAPCAPHIRRSGGGRKPLTDHDPRLLGDLEALVEAVELCRDIGATRAFAPWRAAEVAPGREATTSAELREFLRRSVGTYHHQVGTRKMGAADDPMP